MNNVIMDQHQNRFDQLVSILQSHNYRMTPQRMALLQLIAESKGHPSALQLFEQVKTQYPTMSQATVYKTLDLLKELGEILEINLREDSHYDGNKPYAHPHLICSSCQRIIDGELDIPIVQLVDEISLKYDFLVNRHQLVFYGLCSDCKNVHGVEGK